MKKLLILLLALAAIALVGYYCAYIKNAPTIQKDISDRSQKALNQAGMQWANVGVDGRNITLTGVAPSQIDKDKAEETVHIEGYNQINNQLAVAEKTIPTPIEHSPSIDTSVKSDNKGDIVVSDIDNKLELASNIIDTPEDEVIEAKAIEAEIIKPIADYSLKIYKAENNTITLNGVIDKDSHQAIVALAEEKYGSDKVLDHIKEIAVNKPDSVLHSSTLMLKKMDQLKSGVAELSKNDLLLKGEMLSGNLVKSLTGEIKQALTDDVNVDFDLIEGAVNQLTPLATQQKIAHSAVDSTKGKQCQSNFNTILKKPIRFQSGSTIIQKSSFKVLNDIVLIAKKCNEFSLNIHGHTDSTGQSELNEKLSLGRAESVLKYLMNNHIDTKRLKALGHGAKKPIASNKSVVGRSKNRRIEITVEDKQ